MKTTLIITTSNKSTLERALASVKAQQNGPDEVMLISDGHYDGLYQLWQKFSLPGKFIELTYGPHKDWGHSLRNIGNRIATGDYIHYLDDDDTFRPDVYDTIRQGLAQGEGPHIFKMVVDTNGEVIWHDKEIKYCNVSTQMIFVPRTQTIPLWGHEYWADCVFIKALCEMYPDKIHWHEDIIVNRNH